VEPRVARLEVVALPAARLAGSRGDRAVTPGQQVTMVLAAWTTVPAGTVVTTEMSTGEREQLTLVVKVEALARSAA
jgi:hypothetical protein